jgi:hypothetical protein
MAARGRPKRESPEQNEARERLARSLHETVKTVTPYPPRSGDEWTALLRAAARDIAARQPARPAIPAGESPPGLWDALTWLARREGFAVARGNTGGTSSLTRWDRQYISVSTDLGQPQAEQALAHELGHLLMHQAPWLPADISTAGCRGTRKLEADSVASIVTTWLGLEPPVSSWPSTASWAGSRARALP